MSDSDSPDRSAEDDEGVKVQIPDDFSVSSSPDRDFLPISNPTSESGNGDGEMRMEDRSSSEPEEPEDVGKEEMFVDAPDQYLEDSVVFVDNRVEDQESVYGEIRRLRDELAGAVADKELVSREFAEFKVKRDAIAGELRVLHSRLQMMSNRKSLLGESGEKLVDRLSCAERDAVEVEAVGGAPLHVVVNECSNYASELKVQLDEQLQAESTMRELHVILFAKDEEVDDLFTKVTELSINSDVLASYMVVVQRECVSAREQLYELKRKELELIEKLNRLEEDNGKLLEELEKANERVNGANMLTNQTKAELEQTESRLATSREKLSMAVTKGKALVQQRDSLRQSLNEKTSELEKCLHELKLKSDALEAAEARVEELIRSEDMVVSLQESLSDRDKTFQGIEEILSNVNVPVEVQLLDMLDRFRWLVDQNNQLEGNMLENHKVKNALSSIDMPEAILSSELESQIGWLVQSLTQAREDVSQLVNKVADMQVAVATHASELSSGRLEIDRLMQSLSSEQKDRDLLQTRLEELTGSFEELSQKFSRVSSQRDTFIRTLCEVSGSTVDDQIVDDSSTEIEKFAENCIERMKEKNAILVDLQQKCEDSACQASFMKDHLVKILLEVSEGSVDDFESGGAYVDEMDILSTNCFGKIRERKEKLEELSENYQKLSESLSIISAEKDELLKKLFAIADHMRDNDDADEPSTDVDLLVRKCIWKIKEKRGNLDDLTARYEGLLSQISSEKDELVKKLLEVSGISMDDYIVHNITVADVLLEKCIGKIQERISASSVSSSNEREQLQTVQSLLYVKSAELMLYEELLGEELIDRSIETEKLSAELSLSVEEVITLKAERDSLVKDLERAEDKTSLLREKLSMAVKKGKGLVQEREGFKKTIDQKSEEIERLKRELQLQESIVMDCKNQINSMSSNLDKISNLESEIVMAKDQSDQIEKFLQEKNNMLRLVIDSIEGIITPGNLVFEDPVEKLKWVGENLLELQAGKGHIEQEMAKTKEELYMQTRKLEECQLTVKTLEDALSKAEGNISVLSEEREELKVSKVSAEQELEKIRAKGVFLAGRLAEAQTTINSLEEALSQAEGNLAELENEKREMESHSQHEITSLNARLAGYMEELSGTHGKTENQFSEVVGHLNHLDMLMENEIPLYLLSLDFMRKVESLKSMGLLLQDIHDQFREEGSDVQQFHFDKKDDALISSKVAQFEDAWNSLRVSSEESAGSLSGSISSCISKYVENLMTRDKLLNDNFEMFSSYMDKEIAVLSKAVESIRGEMSHTRSIMGPLKHKVEKLEASNKDQEDTISRLHNNISVLLSSCTNATQDLHMAVSNSTLNLNAGTEIEKLNTRAGDDERDAAEQALPVEAAEKLLMTVKLVRCYFKDFENVKTAWGNITEELQSDLNQTKLAVENASQDRVLYHNRFSDMDSELNSLRHYCSELKLDLENYNLMKGKLQEKEEELLSLYQTLAVKDQEITAHFLSKNQEEIVLKKVNSIQIRQLSKTRSQAELQFPAVSDKLLYIIDNFDEFQNLLHSLSQEKEELESEVAAHVREIEFMKDEAESLYGNNRDLEKEKNGFAELKDGLESLIEKLGGSWASDDKSITGARGLLQVLEKLVAGLILDLETSKAKYQDLGFKFQENQKVVNELSEKVKLLESSLDDRQIYPEPVQERSMYEAPSLAAGSEISEIEDMGPIGLNKAISPPVPSAPVVRTLRKGSSEHLALNIVDLESERLVDHHEDDDDKGHVFKSLNTSGLIPKQAKSVADRVDGIWVSGGRMLMKRPGARISIIAYWLLLHLWVVGTIL